MATAKTTATTTRAQRGIRLYRDHGHAIERLTANVYSVPSCTGNGHYVADIALGHCTCPDHDRAKALGTVCKHGTAAMIFKAKRKARH